MKVIVGAGLQAGAHGAGRRTRTGRGRSGAPATRWRARDRPAVTVPGGRPAVTGRSVVEALGRPLLAQLHDRPAAGQPVGAADLGLLAAAPVPLGLREHRRHRARPAVGVDGDEDQVGAGRPGWRASDSFQRSASTRTPTSMEVRPVQLTWAFTWTRSPTRTGSRKAISSMEAGHGGPLGVPPGDRARRVVHQLHDHAAVHRAQQVGVVVRS